MNVELLGVKKITHFNHFGINTSSNSAECIYIQKMTLNGGPHNDISSALMIFKKEES